MIGALLSLALGGEPVKLFVAADPLNTDRAASAVAAQALADELRLYGLAVTTDLDLQALAAGKRRDQILGCEDKDCGIDDEVLRTGEAKLECLLTGESLMVKIIDMRPRSVTQLSLGAPSIDSSSRTLAADARQLAPQVAAALRRRFGADRVAERPANERPGGAPARRCSATDGCAALLAILLALRASPSARSSAPAESRPRSPA